MADRQQKGFLVIARRKFLIGISAAMVSTPGIVRVESLMTVRGIVMPFHKIHYGFCDRLWVKCRYENGELRGPALMRMIDARILQVSPAILAYDLATWGTGYLSLAAREERIEILWPRVKHLDRLIRAQTA